MTLTKIKYSKLNAQNEKYNGLKFHIKCSCRYVPIPNRDLIFTKPKI